MFEPHVLFIFSCSPALGARASVACSSTTSSRGNLCSAYLYQRYGYYSVEPFVCSFLVVGLHWAHALSPLFVASLCFVSSWFRGRPSVVFTYLLFVSSCWPALAALVSAASFSITSWVNPVLFSFSFRGMTSV